MDHGGYLRIEHLAPKSHLPLIGLNKVSPRRATGHCHCRLWGFSHVCSFNLWVNIIYIAERDCRSKIEAHTCQEMADPLSQIGAIGMGGERQTEIVKETTWSGRTLACSGSYPILAHGVLQENRELLFIG